MQYRKDIQVLRGVAVLFVVLYHFRVSGFDAGFLGVDIFFVISGFLMAVIYRKGEYFDFWRRRARRLLPAYFTVVFVVLLIGVFRLEWGEFTELKQQVIYASAFISNIGFWAKNSYFSDSDFKPLLHLWSIGVEIQFYAVFPLIFFFYDRFRWLPYFAFILSLIFCFLMVRVWPETAFFMMPFRLWEFTAGYIVAIQFSLQGGVAQGRRLQSWSVLLLLGLIFVPFTPIGEGAAGFINGHPGILAFSVVTLTSMILALGISPKVLQLWPSKCIEWVGNYSYSIYLVHFPLLVFYFYQPFKGTWIPVPDVFDIGVLSISTLLLSWGLRRFAEKRGKYHFSFFNGVAVISLIVAAAYGLSSYKESTYPEYEFNARNSVFDRAGFRCGQFFSLINRGEKICQLNNIISDKRVLLIGNSHADSIKDSFSHVASENNYEVWFVVQNESLMGLADSLSLEEILEVINNYKITHVAIHYARGSIDIGTVKSLADSLDRIGVLFGYLSPVPAWPKHIPEMIVSEISENTLKKAPNYKDYLDANQEVFEHLRGNRRKSFVFVDLGKNLCNPDCVNASPEGSAYYFDAKHLTLSGAEVLLPSFRYLFGKWEKNQDLQQ